MKLLTIILAIFFSLNTFAKTHGTWGQVIKSDKPRYGHHYFIYFKQNGKDYAYPIDPTNEKVKAALEKSHSDYVQVFGSVEFEEVNLEKTRHILVFKVNSIKKLSLKDLNENMQDFNNRLDVSRYMVKSPENPHAVKQPSRGLSDKATNAAIFVGGSIIAAEVLSQLLSH